MSDMVTIEIPANLAPVVLSIVKERAYQIQRWGPNFDSKNTANDWTSYILRYCVNACAYNITPKEFEYEMVKVATLATSAIEASRARDVRGPAPRHYDAK